MTSIWIDDIVVGEQDGFADFVIRLDAPASAPVTVDYSTANSTAVGNFSATNDYIISSGALTFAPGETVKTVPVQLVDDAIPEGTEVFTMNLSSPSANATIARKSATATIIDNDAPSGTPQVSIGDLVVDEADGTANFVITLDRPSASVVSIDYATQDGAPITGAAAAQAGSDYVAASDTLNFLPGETAKTVKVQLINDTLPEGAEAFSLKLSNLVGATSLDPVGTAVIAANDEPLVSKSAISIDDVVVGEQDGFADFVIRLDAPTSAPLTVDYSTANSTAVGNFSATNDYIISSGALTFAAGETVKTVRVQLVDDAVAEATEVFKMNLSSPSANATIARASATATIIDNDAPSGTPQVSISNLTVDEADGTANFVITFDRPSAGVVSMNYATQNGAPITGAAAAQAGSDYVAQSGTLNFAPGETAKTVKVGLINDTLQEGAEAFSLALSGLVGATSLDPVGTAVIAANDEPLVSKSAISIDDVVVGEQDGFADFVIRLDAPTSAPLTVDYSTANSTAVGNFSATNDYIISSGALTFAPGETVKTVRVQVVDDPDTEATEVFKMNLSSPSANATIARASATATIIDNDAPSGTPQVSISNLVVDEAAGTANFVITFDRPSAGVVSINYTTEDGTALADKDYVASSGTLNFAPGETAKTVKVGLINDTLQEGAEAFSLALSNLVGATSLDPVGTAVIAANDEPLVSKSAISIDDVVVGEQDGFADFVIRLDAPTSAPLTVDYSTANSTAVGNFSATNDYIISSGALTFAPGETVKTVRVQVVDDPDTEATEVFKMNLSSPSANATIARASATATIIDNDAPSGTPQVSISNLVVDEAAGTANFVITFDRPSAGVVSIDYATQNGTALAGSDYVAASGTVKFAPGETAKTVKVLVVNDTLRESPETFSLKLSDLVGATTLDPVGVATIDDNDAAASADILWQNASTGQASIWDLNGNTLVGGGAVSPNPGPSWRAVGTGDFNKDGHSDILWQKASTGQASIWEMSGNSLIGGGTVSPNPGPSWRAVGTGDFNKDGDSDILWQNRTTGQASIWEMDENKLIGGGVVSPNPGPSWRAVGTGDFNKDGDSDILWQNTSTGQVSIWEMDENHLVGGGAVTPNPGPAWKAIGTGDFNGDGFADILFQNKNSGQVSIWEMDENTLIGGGPVSANPGPSWHAIGTGGGGSDILFQNTNGQASIWEMSGNSIAGGGPVSPSPGPSWHAIGLT